MKERDLTPIIMSAICAAIILLLCFVGGMDYEDAVRDQRVYCERVKAGEWPDYNHNAAEVCK